MTSSTILQAPTLILRPVLDAFLALPTYIQVLSVVIGVPALAIALNVFSQLCLPRDPTLPPMVFYLIPWFGSAATYGQDPYKFFFENRDKYGDLFSFKMMGRTLTAALGPKGNNLSLGGKISQVSAEQAYTHLTTPVFGEGVVYDCPNELLIQQKKFIKGGLSTEALSSYPAMITDECARFFAEEMHLTQATPGPKTVEVFKTMSSLIILTAARTLQGKEVRDLMDSRFAELYHDLDGGFTPLNFLFPNLPLPSYKRRDKAQKEMSDFYVNIMNKREQGESEHGGDMISALQGSIYKDGTELSKRDVAHMMIAILMAGQHTSSATSSWILLHIAHRPDVAEALLEEQKRVCGRPDGTYRDVEFEDVKNNMPVMDSCIRESLRLHAPIHSIYRKVLSPITVPPSLASPSESSSYIVPTSHYMLAAPGVSAMDPRIWTDAETWNPSRWTDEKGAGAEASEAYTGGEQVDYGYGMVSKGTESPYQPFGAGRHRCVGEQFAYMQLSTIIAYLVRNYTMQLETPGRQFPKTNYNTMIVSPLNGKMSFTRRKADV